MKPKDENAAAVLTYFGSAPTPMGLRIRITPLRMNRSNFDLWKKNSKWLILLTI